MENQVMIIKPLPRHIKYLRERAKEFGGTIRVYEKHISLSNVNGDLVGYFFSEEDDSATFLKFQRYEPRKGKQ